MNTTVNQTTPGVNALTTGAADSSDNNDYLRAARNYSLLGQAITTMEEVMLLFTELSNAKFAQMSKKMEVSRDAAEMANKVEALLASITDPNGKASLPEDVIEYMRKNGVAINGKSIDEFLRDDADLDSRWALNNIHSYTIGHTYFCLDSAQAIAKNLDDAGVKIDGQKASDWLKNQENVDGSYSKEAMAKLFSNGRQLLGRADLTAVKSALETFSGRASDFVQQSQLKMQQLIQNFNTAVTMANSLQSMNAESTKSIAQAIR
ncbi:secretion protein EspA [Chromobacterium violaceum]|uniref:Probable secreted protein EspA n=1 Tax=Chromobacterium violaceum (strain ATCC 12472 / DSM 30191 / JCM 1249 / CCUG 213 / NBRC 12614 / NCIMB 9131 / NCTC 9757 / MK) TaxID=243365 RepID=Q7NUW5_CHRVO|nr:secretion protein EspA [Chromobacterium violaceum]AAQ60252.1 probable secreted protein EspA [Chromobacterium violaceum ATCC 12472]SUX35780.1 Secretion system effector B [Chromobacterium violaceum]